MEKFELEVALALLPVMTGQEQITKSLIDNIIFYGDMLDNGSKQFLINFVLKTRLTSKAKFYLSSSYENLESLVSDMKKHLLPKKSSIAIQTQLFNCRQGNRSIQQFGSEIEDLFYNLTLAQSDGDREKFEILLPINEEMAIRRFADGLNNTRISIIIVARQFKSLSEAIQIALDEDIMMSLNRQNSFRQPYDNQGYHKYQSTPRNNYNLTNVRNNIEQPTCNKQIVRCPAPVSDSRIPNRALDIMRDQQTNYVAEDTLGTLNNFNENKVMKSDPVTCEMCCNLNSNVDSLKVNTESSLDDFKCENKNISSLEKSEERSIKNNCTDLTDQRILESRCDEPMVQSFEKRNSFTELFFTDSLNLDTKNRKCLFSKEGLCTYVPAKLAIYIEYRSLSNGKVLAKDFELFCNDLEIRGLIVDDKNIESLKCLMSKNKVILPRLIVKSCSSEVYKRDDIKGFKTKNENMKESKSVNYSNGCVNHKETNEKNNYFESMLLEQMYDTRSVGIT